MQKQDPDVFDVGGVGLGPFNLSAAALLDPVERLTARFFEREKEFQWHPGLLFPESTIQVSFLKDLVTLADPTSKYSFLAFLFANHRLYRFINANFGRVSRVEFNQYFRWVANRIAGLEFGREVREISFDGTTFVLDLDSGQSRCRNIILATGLQPNIPQCAVPFINGAEATVLHATKYLHYDPPTKGKRIAVIGGGQTGAEVIHHLLSNPGRSPKTLLWISKRSNFLPLDESPFTNELFTPNYSDYFYGLSSQDRMSMLAEQKLASDGVSDGLLERIYQCLYEAEFLNGQGRCWSLLPKCELVNLCTSPHGGWKLTLRDPSKYCPTLVEADVVILATGMTYKQLPALAPLKGRLRLGDNGFAIRDDFSIEWDGPEWMRIYIQNGARHYRGIADPNLSLMAWRSARIVNSLAGTAIYDIAENSSVFDLSTSGSPERILENDYLSTNRQPATERPMLAVES